MKKRKIVKVHNNGNITTSVNFDALKRYIQTANGIVLPFQGPRQSIATFRFLYDKVGERENAIAQAEYSLKLEPELKGAQRFIKRCRKLA